MTDAASPKRPRGRPRVHATPEAAADAARARASAHTTARRARLREVTIALDPEVAAAGDALVSERGLGGWSDLVTALIRAARRPA